MRKILLVSIVFVSLFWVSCSIPRDKTGLVTCTVTPTILQATNTPQLSTAVPTSRTSGATIIPVVEQQYCPSQREVQWSELNLMQTTRLILRDHHEKLYLLGKDTDGIQELNLAMNAQPSSRIAISPDGQRLAYNVLVEHADSSATYELWVMSFDGSLNQPIAEEKFLGSSPIWLYNDLIMVWGKASKDWLCPQLMLLVNPVTYDVKEFSLPFPKLDISSCIKWPALSPDISKMVYPESTYPSAGLFWYLYDFRTGTKKTILPWLNKGPEDTTGLSYAWTQEGFSLVLPEGNKLFYYANMSMEDLYNKNPSYYQIDLPELATLGSWSESIPWWSPESNQIALDLLSPDVDLTTSSLPVYFQPTSFYVVDVGQLQLRDYCLDRSVLSSGKTGSKSPVAYVSKDGEYIAWTVYEPVSRVPLEIRILELKSGKVATIDVREAKMEVVGWGVVPDSGK